MKAVYGFNFKCSADFNQQLANGKQCEIESPIAKMPNSINSAWLIIIDSTVGLSPIHV